MGFTARDRLPARVQRSEAGTVSMAVAEAAYRDYGRLYDQSLERILERGGFSWAEMVYQLYAEIVRLEQGDEVARELRMQDHIGPRR
jgi:hypothetical protein